MTEISKITDLTLDERNANLGTERGLQMLADSLRKYGAGRSILVDKEGRVIAGNKTLAQAIEAGIEDLLVVETDGSQLVAVKRLDLDLDDGDRARAMAYADNRTSEVGLDWNADQLLADLEGGLDLSGLFGKDELDQLLKELVVKNDDELQLSSWDVPDALWPTDNEWGIPLLDIQLQARTVDLPVMVWGAAGRRTRMKGTWMFYVDDYRFEALWKDPSPVVNSGCANIVEPNFSIGPQTPRAVALWHVYRKRWLARWWQSYGIKVFVDLNVEAEIFGDIMLLGVPKGWQAYATRGYVDRVDKTMEEYELAKTRADNITFLVYGGSKAVQSLAQEYGWVWIPEHMDVKHRGMVING